MNHGISFKIILGIKRSIKQTKPPPLHQHAKQRIIKRRVIHQLFQLLIKGTRVEKETVSWNRELSTTRIESWRSWSNSFNIILDKEVRIWVILVKEFCKRIYFLTLFEIVDCIKLCSELFLGRKRERRRRRRVRRRRRRRRRRRNIFRRDQQSRRPLCNHIIIRK